VSIAGLKLSLKSFEQSSIFLQALHKASLLFSPIKLIFLDFLENLSNN
jgi:hypothetical protein